MGRDLEVRRLIRLNLHKRGLQAREVDSLVSVSPASEAPDLIIVDVDTPYSQEWEEVRAWRQSQGGGEVPLIVLFSIAPSERYLASVAPAWWLEKPFAMESLLALVWDMLAQQDTVVRNAVDGNRRKEGS